LDEAVRKIIAGVSPHAGDHRLATSVVSHRSPSWVRRFQISNETVVRPRQRGWYGDREPAGLSAEHECLAHDDEACSKPPDTRERSSEALASRGVHPGPVAVE
jgi:hypothetical protein